MAPTGTSIWLEYYKEPDPKWTFEFDVDLLDGYGGVSAAAARATLLTAIKLATLVEFTYRDDTGNTRNFYVKLRQPQGSEATGPDERGTMRLRAVEI